MQSYCSFARKREKGDVHRDHHDSEHGTPPENDDDLFRRLMLEISQAGLSFETVLRRKKAIYGAFSSIGKVARFTNKEVEKLMRNNGIIRNRLKIEAAIFNANAIKRLQKDYGSFRKWLDSHHPRSKEEWVKLFKRTFKFTGGEIVNEFLMSTGHLPGAHDADCPVGKGLKAKYKG
jgi:DNA-3-methyladenine glycosylase I